MANKHIKDVQFPISQENTNQNHLTPLRMTIIRQQIISVGEDVEKRELLYSVGGNENWCSPFGKLYGGFSKEKNLLDNPAIPLLGIFLNKTKTLIQKISFLHHYVHCIIRESTVFKK